VTYDVRYVLVGRIVEVLRGDPALNTLLFPPGADAVGPDDRRIYAENVELPEGPIRSVLPRILVAAIETPFPAEQAAADGPLPYADCLVWTHIFVEADRPQLGEAISARVRDILISTPLSDSRIIASALVPSGTRQPVREVAFRNAWRMSREYRTQAGVLA
jgi:hypothetical protein